MENITTDTCAYREMDITVYSFEFVKSYFCPIEIRDWFVQSRISHYTSFLTWSFMNNSIFWFALNFKGEKGKNETGAKFSL